eukprot:3867033-Amphidinium_carterae.2
MTNGIQSKCQHFRLQCVDWLTCSWSKNLLHKWGWEQPLQQTTRCFRAFLIPTRFNKVCTMRVTAL